ncbi:hypothetical protein FOL47_000422 [Perkinsus chesapeaki]|uniref:RING-type domain-containing protein n=1 Tax=Perkinsus chesapeaki TaxID=330153 RepID=A0A7J6MME3_PERCH|nr:hypothetical protein FOL47_000422 [Perkinsus chesapeaki]
MTERSNATLIDLALPRRFKWVWIAGLVVVGIAFIVFAVLHKTFPDLIIIFAVGLIWILLPLGILFGTLVRRYGFKQAMHNLNFGLTGEEADEVMAASSRVPTPEDKQSFLAVAKSSSMVTLATMTGAEDLCPICLDEEDMGESLITLRCGHIFHEKCIDSVIDTAYDKMYAPNYLGLPILSRDDVLSSLRCPLCRSQMTDVEEEHDIEEGISTTTTPAPPQSTTTNVDDSASQGSPVTARTISRVNAAFDIPAMEDPSDSTSQQSFDDGTLERLPGGDGDVDNTMVISL